MQQFNNVIFDVDGTILDTSEGVLSAVKYTIDYFNLKPLDEECLHSFIGPRIQDSFKRVYSLDDNTISKIADIFRTKYKNDYLLLAKPYEGIYKVFDRLKEEKIGIAIATYKREDYAQRLLNYFSFDKYTNVICGSDFDGKLKKKDIINIAIDKLSSNNNSKILMIGDSENDAIGANQANINFLGVTYGFGFKSDSDVTAYSSIGVANNTNDIIRFVLGESL